MWNFVEQIYDDPSTIIWNYSVWLIYTLIVSDVFLYFVPSWMQAFQRRSAWCPGTRKVSWLWRTPTWSVALTAPSRSCSRLLRALCSAIFGPRVGTAQTSRTLLHYMEGPGSLRQHQHSEGSGGQQGTWWTSVTYTDPVAPGSLFLKV